MIFLAGLGAAVVATTLRFNLWFVVRTLPTEAIDQRRLARPWTRTADLLLAAALAAGGALALSGHPEVAIVGVNRMVERPMLKNGQVVARQLMNLSSSFDHRVVDGMDAAQFIQAIRALLETPALLFID